MVKQRGRGRKRGKSLGNPRSSKKGRSDPEGLLNILISPMPLAICFKVM